MPGLSEAKTMHVIFVNFYRIGFVEEPSGVRSLIEITETNQLSNLTEDASKTIMG